MSHKYILAISGNTYASHFKHALRSGGCIIRQEERMYEWFEPFLQPWVHYVPVQWDLSNLEEQILWAMNHESEAQNIAFRAQKAGEMLFEPNSMACYTYVALKTMHAFMGYTLSKDVAEFQPLLRVCKRRAGIQCLHKLPGKLEFR